MSKDLYNSQIVDEENYVCNSDRVMTRFHCLCGLLFCDIYLFLKIIFLRIAQNGAPLFSLAHTDNNSGIDSTQDCQKLGFVFEIFSATGRRIFNRVFSKFTQPRLQLIANAIAKTFTASTHSSHVMMPRFVSVQPRRA